MAGDYEIPRRRVLINGFGRVGRALFRIASISRNVEVVRINDPLPVKQLAYLLKYDSVMNRLFAEVEIAEDSLTVAGRRVAVSHAETLSGAETDGIDFVINSSGRNNSRANLEAIAGFGVSRVIVSQPLAEGIADRTILMGVNNTDLRKQDRIISAGSCTAHCYTPLIKLLRERFEITRGYMMTVHAYTSGQSIVDSGHPTDPRRGRAAAQNIVPTTTESLVAFEQVMPEMAGRIVGMAQRVPVVDGSNLELILELDRNVRVDDLNAFIREQSESRFQHIIEYTADPIVSQDIVGNPHSCVFDSLLTHVIEGDHPLVRLIAWYDNEWGYANRLAELLELCAVTSPSMKG